MTPIQSRSATTRVIDGPSGPITVAPGETVEVDDDLAKSLLEQPDRWGKPSKRKPSVTSEES